MKDVHKLYKHSRKRLDIALRNLSADMECLKSHDRNAPVFTHWMKSLRENLAEAQQAFHEMNAYQNALFTCEEMRVGQETKQAIDPDKKSTWRHYG